MFLHDRKRWAIAHTKKCQQRVCSHRLNHANKHVDVARLLRILCRSQIGQGHSGNPMHQIFMNIRNGARDLNCKPFYNLEIFVCFTFSKLSRSCKVIVLWTCTWVNDNKRARVRMVSVIANQYCSGT